MIPRAVEQVFRVAEDLRSKGWEYKIEGQFLEIVRPLSYLRSVSNLRAVQRNHQRPPRKT